MTKFVLFSTQRSGSTWVIDRLNRYHGVQAYGEQLLREKRLWDVGPDDYPRYFEIDRTTLPGLSPRPFSLFAYLDGLYQKEGQQRERIVGFKLMYSALRQYPEVWLYLHLRRVRLIHLVRENYLDVLISKRLVVAKGQAHLLAGITENKEAERESVTISLDPTTLLADLRWLKQKTDTMRRLLRFSALRYHIVTYEALLQNPASFDTIQSFLGIEHDPSGNVADSAHMQSSLRKIRCGGYAETIENFAEIEPLLTNSPFAHLLEERPRGGSTDG